MLDKLITVEEMAQLLDSGCYNNFIKGYMAITLDEMGMSKEFIDRAKATLKDIFDDTEALEALKRG